MRIRYCSSDVCSSDLHVLYVDLPDGRQVSWHMSPSEVPLLEGIPNYQGTWNGTFLAREPGWCQFHCADDCAPRDQDEAELIKAVLSAHRAGLRVKSRSEEHTSELQSLMRLSYAVFCLKKKNAKISKKTTSGIKQYA